MSSIRNERGTYAESSLRVLVAARKWSILAAQIGPDRHGRVAVSGAPWTLEQGQFPRSTKSPKQARVPSMQ